MKPRIAWLLVVLFLITTNIAAAFIVDARFFKRRPVVNYTSSVIALRDNVAGYQKQATKIFSKPFLKKMYDGVYYLEEKEIDMQRKKFALALNDAAEKYDSVDIFLLAHGNRVVEWLFGMPARIKEKIRLVYNCGCGNYYQGNEWKIEGAKYYLAHKGKYSYSPVFYYYFLKRFANGYPLTDAVNMANKKTIFLLRLFGLSRHSASESCAYFYP
jgi:hypothetical protein